MPIPRLICGKESDWKVRSHLNLRCGYGNCNLRKAKCDDNNLGCRRCTASMFFAITATKLSFFSYLMNLPHSEYLSAKTSLNTNPNNANFRISTSRGFRITNVYALSDQEHLEILNRLKI